MKKELLSFINVLSIMLLWLFLYTITAEMALFSKGNAVKTHLYKTCTSYEAAMNQAVNDFYNGRRYVMLTGLLDLNDEDVTRMKNEEKIHGFSYIHLGCIRGNRYISVYEQIMRREINKKAGKCLFRTLDAYTLALFFDKMH